MNIVLIGAPLAGKGTQAELLSKNYGFIHISTGDLLREIMLKNTPLGKEVKGYMDKHVLVPDELTIKVLKEKLSNISSNKDIILDGFPRTLNQAKLLDNILSVDKAIFIDTKLEQLLQRINGRYVCSVCKKVNTVENFDNLTCYDCGGTLVKRQDDTPEIVKQRFDEFNTITYPIVDYYKQKGILNVVQSNGTIQDDYNKVIDCIKK